ncbi:MAG: hypothetical protein ABIN36_08515, partial [Ferruginibacter sp.]
MNQHLQKIFDFIQQDEKLTAEEKALLTKAAKSTDSDLSISEFKLDRTEKVKRTTAILLEETIEELEQKRKAVEAQNKELEIETALERVRARTMAMQHSDELAHASFVLDSQVRALGIKTRGCAFNIYGDNESTEWFSSEMGAMPVYKTPREALFLRYFEAGKNGEQIHIEKFEGEACVAHYEYLCALPGIGDGLKAMIAAGGSLPTHQIDHAVYFKYGYLLFITADEVPEAHDIFIRFAKVFEQTYTRFLDLQKAEAQAKEAKIEAALEKVRSRSLAMHHANELGEVVVVIVEKIKELDIEMDGGITLVTFIPGSKDFLEWHANPDQSGDTLTGVLSYFDHTIFNDCVAAVEQGMELLTKVYSKEEKDSYINYLAEHIAYIPDDMAQWIRE